MNREKPLFGLAFSALGVLGLRDEFQSYFVNKHFGESNKLGDPDREKALEMILECIREQGLAMTVNEAYQIHMAVKKTAKIPGELAEVGVYKGGSARVICEAKGNRVLHLFDTWRGMPKPGEFDTVFQKGEYRASLADVKQYLSSYENVHFHKGQFPETAGPVLNSRFAFVHLDVDIYESTKDCLEFFYPRMNKGGVIISHDYGLHSGVTKAFDEFFPPKPEPIFEVSGLEGTQVMIVKM